MILQIRRRDLGLDIVLLTKANFNNIYKSVFEKNANEVLRRQNATETKLF